MIFINNRSGLPQMVDSHSEAFSSPRAATKTPTFFRRCAGNTFPSKMDMFFLYLRVINQHNGNIMNFYGFVVGNSLIDIHIVNIVVHCLMESLRWGNDYRKATSMRELQHFSLQQFLCYSRVFRPT